MNKFFARIILAMILITAIGGTYLEARYRGHRRGRHHRGYRRHGWYRYRTPLMISRTFSDIMLAQSIAKRDGATRQLIDAINSQSKTIKMMHEDMLRIKRRIDNIEEDLASLEKSWKK